MGVSQGKYPEIVEKIRKNRSIPDQPETAPQKEISRATAANLCYNHPTNPKGGATGGWLKFYLSATAVLKHKSDSLRAATTFWFSDP